MWDKVIKKTIDVKAKASYQLLSHTKEIDAQCFWGLRFVKNEESTRLENKDSEKTKSSYSFSANFRG